MVILLIVVEELIGEEVTEKTEEKTFLNWNEEIEISNRQLYIHIIYIFVTLDKNCKH